MKTSTLTNKQKEILLYLYKFRFLNTHQLQNLLHHKNSNRTLSWLKALIENKYVKRHYERKSFSDTNKAAIYYLGPKSRDILHKLKNIELEQLEYIYQEHRRVDKFIGHCLFIADTYIYFQAHKDEKEELKFFTKSDLHGYDYFPDPKPDAFISANGETTKRYFLDIFDDFTPPFVLRKRVRKYLEYADESTWNENTNYTPLPINLFICPNESMKKHVSNYASAVLKKSYNDKIKLFLTTKKRIEQNESNIWVKVEA